MDIGLDVNDDIAALLESGKIDENASVTEIAAFLAGEEPAQGTDAKTDDAAAAADADKAKGEGGDSGKSEQAAAGETQDANKATATDGKQNAEQTSSARDQQSKVDTDPDAENGDGSFSKHPIYGVLKGTRSTLADARRKLDEVEQQRTQEREARERAERERDELKAQLDANKQDTKDVQVAARAAGVKGDIRTIDVSKLRNNFPDEIVDAIETIQAQNSTLVGEVNALRQRDAGRQQDESARRAAVLQDDIDAVPKLAEWQGSDTAIGKAMWAAATALDDELRADPEWSGKTRVERFQEIARQLDPQPSQPSSKSNPKPPAAGKSVDDALAAATARALPISHSGLPAGSPPAQSEAEGIDKMDVTQVADKLANMTDDQIEALLARVG